MPLSKMQWPNAQESCGCEVQTTRLRRKRAWWLQGQTLERFEHEVEPEIEAVLKNVDVQEADLYIRIYMIGKTQDTSRPTLMVCCVNSEVRRTAKESLRTSEVIISNPGFALGSIDLPLEQSVPARALAHQSSASGFNQKAEELKYSSDLDVFSTSPDPKIGRRLCTSYSRANDAFSTGGVIVADPEGFYQLTVGHVHKKIDAAPSPIDPDACSFDGQSGSDSDSGISAWEQDMHRASMSFSELPNFDDSDTESVITQSTTSGNIGDSTFTADTVITSLSSVIPNGTTKPPSLIKVGTIAFHSDQGKNRHLDYALISIKPPEHTTFNTIDFNRDGMAQNLLVQRVTPVGTLEQRVITVTGSGGVLTGTLIPGSTLWRRSNQNHVQRLYTVQLDGLVATGDSGSIVVDAVSGDLFGHIVSGCPGTCIAYITSAVEIFEDFTTSSKDFISLPSSKRPLEVLVAPNSLSERMANGKIRHYAVPAKKRRIITKRKSGFSKLPNQNSHSLYSLRKDNPGITPIAYMDPSIDSLAGMWDHKFSRPRSANALARNNSPYLTTLEIQGISGFDLIEYFFDSHDISDPDKKEIIAFLRDWTPEGMRVSARSCQRPNSIVESVICNTGTEPNFTLSSPLNPHQLYETLLKHLNNSSSHRNGLKSTTSTTVECGRNSNVDGIKAINITIADPDAMSIMPLIKTATSNEARGLANGLVNYFALRPALKVSLEACSYNLEFHLPFYAFERSLYHCARSDHRQHRNGKPLRRSFDLAFLELESTNIPPLRKSTLHEAQISFILTGTSNQRWIAYLLTDTFFSEDSYENFIAEIHERSIEMQLQSRDYFLFILNKNLGKYKTSWRGLVSIFQRSIPQYISICSKQVNYGDVSNSAKERHGGITRILGILKQIDGCLLRTNLEFKRFLGHDKVFFQDKVAPQETLEKKKLYWASIQNTVHELTIHEHVLGELITQCEDFKRDVALYTPLHRTQIAAMKPFGSNAILMTLFVALPLVISSSIFSMQAGSLPFRKSFTSFVLCVLLFSFCLCVPVIATFSPMRKYFRAGNSHVE